eukprot:gene21679-28054_t
MISEERQRELTKIAKGMKPFLPPNVTCHREFQSNGKPFYLFKHAELGTLGRMFIMPNGNESQFMFDVMGEEDDPFIEQKKGLGKGKGTVKPINLPSQIHTIKAEHITCKTCDALVAVIVYAEEATTAAELADHATIFYKKAKELNVPTWVLGKEMVSDIVFMTYFSIFNTLKIWPEREEPRLLSEMEIDDLLFPLVEYHCEEED